MLGRRVLCFVGLLWVVLACACGGAQGPGSFSDLAQNPDEEPEGPETPAPDAVGSDAWGKGQRPAGAAFDVYTYPGELPQLAVAGDKESKLPLEHTHVKVRLSGFVAEVEVAQTYKNPFDAPIEAIYVFPLPENSAVNRMKMLIGPRVIEAEVQERRAARETYEAAKEEGYTAALLEQERPNIFTQSVANIAPGHKIDVVIHYVQDLGYDAGEYEFVFPMVVGPRYIAGAPAAGSQTPARGAGTYKDTDRVPDASRITPPVVGSGERSGHDISLELVADASVAVGDFEIATHEVVTRKPGDGTFHLTLAERKSLPNRDFVLRYRVGGGEPKATLLTGKGRSGDYFSLVVHPPALDVDELVGRREIVFVVDVSGSMDGPPLGLCQAAMRDAITRLRPVDTFNIITFAGSTGKAFPRARPANTANVRQALDYVNQMSAGGGTEMMDAVAAALTPDVAEGRHRYVFFLTDGFVGEDNQILAASRRFVETLDGKGQRARVFGFGVGSSPNRHLITGLSQAGRGIAVYAGNREDPARAVNRFYRYIDRSILRDVRVDWGDLAPSAVLPAELPDLFASHPIILHGKFTGPGTKPIVVRARAGDREVEIPVTTRLTATPNAPREVLGTLWARAMVGALEETLWRGPDPTAQAMITQLGIEHHLVTPFTSFVAVDRSQKVGDGSPTTVVQPIDSPEGVDPDMAGARTSSNGTILLSGPLKGAPAVRAMRSSQMQIYAVQRIRPGCGCRLVGATDDGGAGRSAWPALTTLAIAMIVRLASRAGRITRRRRDESRSGTRERHSRPPARGPGTPR